MRDVLHAPRFVDRAPGEIVATLLDEKKYLCSERTMYRMLAQEGSSRERRDQIYHPRYTKPELVAEAADEVWTWDITKLLGPQKWVYYYLYVILDLFSRYVVGWMVAEKENASLAARLIEESCSKHAVRPEILTLHSDRGAPMTANHTAQRLSDLGVTQSLSRPRVSDDNPFSEAQFKTVTYHPGYPGRFASPPDAVDCCRSFFPWYNHEHRHAGIAMLTPADVYFGRAATILAQRQRVLDQAYAAHPDRFPRGRPRAPALPDAVYINPPQADPTKGGAH